MLLIYFILYTFPFPLGYIPVVGGDVSQAVDKAWKTITPWVGEHVIGIGGNMYLGPTGSGDTTSDYVRLATSIAVTVFLTAVWSLVDRRPRSYGVARWLLIACRFYLGLTMLGYGFAKVFPNQMPFPTLEKLLMPYGESSPMGLVWRFIGVSTPYSIFAGLGETIGGLLLFWRHTRALGAAVLIGVMANVAMLNYAYDVPVKLFSSHLLLMAIAILLVDRRRLLAVFVLNRPAPAADLRPPLPWLWARITSQIAKVLVIGWIVYMQIVGGLESYRTYGNGRARSELWGIHDVESFSMDGEEQPPLITDELRWRGLVVDRELPMSFGGRESPGSVAVQRMNGRFQRHLVELDEDAKTITFLPRRTSAETPESLKAPGDVLTYERPKAKVLLLRGTWKGSDVEIRLRERNIESLLLVGRSYHWVNEFPYNR